MPTGIESRAKTLRFTEFSFKPMFVTNLVPVHCMRINTSEEEILQPASRRVLPSVRVAARITYKNT